jgi:4-carboxymuconolactone decarboxylase
MSKMPKASRRTSPASSTPETAPRADEADLYARGLDVRRAVLGARHVDQALAADGFGRELDDLITRYAWGEIWTRPGLPRHTRSLLTIAMLVAVNRIEELRLHVRAAANNGVTRPEVKEVLLQTAIYCGVPAAHAAFRVAEEVYAALDRESTAAR